MAPLEIERKFLVKKTDELLSACTSCTHITQTYLINGDDGLQRRVRRSETDGKVVCTYTEKRFIKPMVREENECVITEERYNQLLTEADTELDPVEKSRYILIYEDQHFEIDVYPFSDTLCTMELELADVSQEIHFPPCAEIIKEVTGDTRYSNVTLSVTHSLAE